MDGCRPGDKSGSELVSVLAVALFKTARATGLVLEPLGSQRGLHLPIGRLGFRIIKTDFFTELHKLSIKAQRSMFAVIFLSR